MIKLNNKNITYVALADSSNSLKAPKEIWYADSNNSVKLVYRRKDALIEGEDYEKYHWLVGDGHSYINTLKLIKSDSEVRSIIIPTSDDFTKWKYIYANDPSDIASTFMCVLLKNNSTLHFRHKRGNVTFAINTEYECVHSIDSVKVNNEVLTPVSESEFQESDAPLYLFSAPTISSTSDLLFNGYIKYVILSDELNLIPCKLLKPVPKWLDANGIRRQVGECGMIDLVSGKFYGNVNSNGTFTVENYYEKKEWLQGRNGAYIDTNYYPIVGTDVFSVHFHYDGTMRNPDGGEQDAFGVNYKDSNENNFIRAFINSSNYLSCSYYKYIDRYPSTGIHSEDWNIDNLLINGSKFQYSANEISYSFDNNDIQLQVCPYTLYVFKNNDQVFNQNCYLHGDVSSFKITDTSSNTKMNLIPCTLTMDLPASMDANGIARTKGTSGMWDLVSDRFYGNVASSGTFKAVNLAEGVDYEVHQWLKGRNGAFINTMYPANTGEDAFIVKGRYDGTLRNPLGKEQAIFGVVEKFSYSDDAIWCYTYIDGGNQVKPILLKINAATAFPDNVPLRSLTKEFVAVLKNSNSDYYAENNGQAAIYSNLGVVDKTIGNVYLFTRNTENIPTQAAERYFHGDIAYFRITDPTFSIDRVNMTPCRLLRPIPATLDGNGISRNAGECGMYDTVNDKFYGNVASRGTFSVEDDS